MISVCRDEISPRPAGADLMLRLRVEVIFRPDKVGQFSTWYLFRFVYNFFEFFFVTMSVYETENPWISINFNFFLLELFRNEKQLFANALQNGIFQSFTILLRKHKCLCISLIKLQT